MTDNSKKKILDPCAFRTKDRSCILSDQAQIEPGRNMKLAIYFSHGLVCEESDQFFFKTHKKFDLFCTLFFF